MISKTISSDRSAVLISHTAAYRLSRSEKGTVPSVRHSPPVQSLFSHFRPWFGPGMCSGCLPRISPPLNLPAFPLITGGAEGVL